MDFVLQRGFQGMEQAEFDALIQKSASSQPQGHKNLDMSLELNPGNHDGLGSQMGLSKTDAFS